MNAIELFKPGGKPAGVFYCEKCRVVHLVIEVAEQCCVPKRCQCGAEVERYYTICTACRTAKEKQKEAERFEKAEKLTTWDGPVFCEGIGYQDGYFRDVHELEDYIYDQHDGDDRPTYCWTCSTRLFCQLDYDQIIENATQEAYEDWDGEVNGGPQLKTAIARFNLANAGHQLWDPNYKVALILGPANQIEGVPNA